MTHHGRNPKHTLGRCARGASIIADAVTALSNNWNDVNSFISPYNYSGRMATATTYRFAMVGGQGVPFLQPAGSSFADPAQGTTAVSTI